MQSPATNAQDVTDQVIRIRPLPGHVYDFNGFILCQSAENQPLKQRRSFRFCEPGRLALSRERFSSDPAGEAL